MSADEQVRQYAKMLLAILDGAEWEGRNHKDDPNWITCSCATHDPLMFSRCNIRLKPWKLTGTVNGHTLPPGASWHRVDGWTDDMLPAPFRPIALGEIPCMGDQFQTIRERWTDVSSVRIDPVGSRDFYYRTSRPIPFTLTPEQIADGWLQWSGGECPVEPESRPTVMFRSERTLQVQSGAKAMAWDHSDSGGDIIAYRPDPYGKFRQALADGKVIQCKDSYYKWVDLERPVFDAPLDQYREKPEPQWLPLCDDDIPPGSVIRLIQANSRVHWLPVYPLIAGVDVPDKGKWDFLSFDDMFNAWQINRSIAAGKWDPTAWEPCRKQAP